MPTKMISVRIDTELLDYLQKKAEFEHRTLSNTITSILQNDKEGKNEDITKAIKHQLYTRYMDKPNEVKELFDMIDNLRSVRKRNHEAVYGG